MHPTPTIDIAAVALLLRDDIDALQRHVENAKEQAHEHAVVPTELLESLMHQFQALYQAQGAILGYADELEDADVGRKHSQIAAEIRQHVIDGQIPALAHRHAAELARGH